MVVFAGPRGKPDEQRKSGGPAAWASRVAAASSLRSVTSAVIDLGWLALSISGNLRGTERSSKYERMTMRSFVSSFSRQL